MMDNLPMSLICPEGRSWPRNSLEWCEISQPWEWRHYDLTHWVQDRITIISQGHFQIHFVNENTRFWCTFPLNYAPWGISIIVSDDGSTPIRRHVIIWTNGGLVNRPLYAPRPRWVEHQSCIKVFYHTYLIKGQTVWRTKIHFLKLKTAIFET